MRGISWRAYCPVVVLSVLFFCAGCRSIEAPKKPDAIWAPPKWEKSTRTEDKVWSSIRSKTIDTSKPFSLSELIDLALQNSPATREVWEKARAAQALVTEANSKLYPDINIGGGAEYNKKVANRKFDEIDEINYGPEAKLTFMILDFGGRSASIRKAKQTLLSSNFQFNRAIQDLLLAVEEAYYEFYSAQSALVAAEADVKDAETSLDAAQQKMNAGLGVKLDVLQARSNYDDALYTREVARGQIKIAEGNLAVIIGVPADTDMDIVNPREDVPDNLTGEDIRGVIDMALARRPDIASIRADVRAKEAAVIVARSGLWPTLNAGASTDANWYKYYGDERNDPDKDEDDYEVSGYLSVNWNVFDGFSNWALLQQSKALAEASREELRRSELQASADVWSRFYNYKTAVSKKQFSKAFYDTAGESYGLALEGYNAGLKTILDLLQAQSELSDARSKLIQSQKDLFIALVQMAHSMGIIGTKQQYNASAGGV
ncbi:MAG: TolC family protein [Candidatus Omnitrophota bacterium]